MSDEKRRLPRYVDGRIKIGFMPGKNVLKASPFFILIILLTYIFLNPVNLFIGTISLGVVVGLFSEFNNKETGMDIIKEYIRYQFEGDKVWGRSGREIENIKKITIVKIQEESEEK